MTFDITLRNNNVVNSTFDILLSDIVTDSWIPRIIIIM